MQLKALAILILFSLMTLPGCSGGVAQFAPGSDSSGAGSLIACPLVYAMSTVSLEVTLPSPRPQEYSVEVDDALFTYDSCAAPAPRDAREARVYFEDRQLRLMLEVEPWSKYRSVFLTETPTLAAIKNQVRVRVSSRSSCEDPKVIVSDVVVPLTWDIALASGGCTQTYAQATGRR